MSGELVTLSAGMDMILGSATANDYGAFTAADITVSLSPGLYSLWATGDGGSRASAPMVVVAEK